MDNKTDGNINTSQTPDNQNPGSSKGKTLDKESKKKLKKLLRVQNRTLFSHCVTALVGVEFIYSFVTFFVFTPLISKLLSLALNATAGKQITGFGELFSNPLYILALLFSGLVACMWQFVEYSLMINGIDRIHRGQAVTAVDLFKKAFQDCGRVMAVKNWPIVLASGLLIPFTNLFISSSYLSVLQIPEFIMDAILENTFYTIGFFILTLGLTILCLFWMYIFHFFILDGLDFKEASSKSIELMKSNFLRLVWEPVYRKIVIYLFWGIIGLLILSVISIICLTVVENDKLVFAVSIATSQYFVPVYESIVDYVANIAYFVILSTIFYAVVRHESLPELFARPRFRSRAFLPSVLVILTLIGLGYGLAAYLAPSEVLDFLIGGKLGITAHRGYSENAPENTLPAFQAAIDLGIPDFVELDVQMTKDGVVVVSHDKTLKRTAGVDERICDLTYAELQKIKVTSTDSHGNEVSASIPTLDQVLDLCKNRIKVNIEIKSLEESPDLEKETVRIIHDNEFSDSCVITSTTYDTLKKVKAIDPSLKTGYILAMAAGDYYDLPYADFFSVETTLVSESMVESIQDLGKQVHVWTVSNGSDAKNMMKMGVDNIITNDPLTISSAAIQYSSDPMLLYNMYLEYRGKQNSVVANYILGEYISSSDDAAEELPPGEIAA